MPKKRRAARRVISRTTPSFSGTAVKNLELESAIMKEMLD